jgi:alkaline phosphatase D
VSRRRFLELLAAAGAGGLVLPMAGCSPDEEGTSVPDGTDASDISIGPVTPAPSDAFPDGVMAGDPRPDGAVIWTRVAPDQDMPELGWEVAEDDAFTRVIAGGTVRPDPERDGTAHVDVGGLESDGWYRYRFVGTAGASPVGRLRTAPSPESTPDRLRLAFCSCQQINDSLYVAHRAMTSEPDLDFFLHLGDYVYVSDEETQTLDDYRAVYHRFKANPLLQELQATIPIVAMFDDGEFYNGIDRTGDPDRLAAARDAWFETFPVLPADGDHQAHRSLGWGTLADLFVLDVRSFRDPAIESSDTADPEGAEMLAPGRTTLGGPQRTWLLNGLAASTTGWRLLGNPYNMAMARIVDRDPGPPRPDGALPGAGSYFPNEGWDDYSAERREILESLRDNGVADVVSLSGHTHVWIAGHMQPDPDDPASPTVAYDFTCGSLTADPDVLTAEGSTPDAERATYRALEETGLGINPHLTYLNFVDQGYGLVEITPEEMIVEFKLIDPFDDDAEARVGARFVVARGGDQMRTERFSEAER